MPNDVFISYRRKDIDFVTQLHRELTGRGISAWFDKESIEVGDHWRSSIAEGIRDCSVFVLVLSPDAIQSVNIRKEVDLAETHNKPIVPLMWRQTEIPVAFEYALAGVQWIEFNETASAENFAELADVVGKVMGGAAAEPPKPAEPAPQKTRPQRGRGGRGRGGRGTAQTVSAASAGIGVITKVVTQIATFTTDEQDAVNDELKWLFAAADHFLAVRQRQAEPSTAVPVDIPPEAEVDDGATNAILPGLDDFSQQMIATQIEGLVKQISIYLRNLAIELEKQAMLGGAAASNLALINSIKLQQKSIAERTQEMAGLMQQVYGIKVYGPDDIANQLG